MPDGGGRRHGAFGLDDRVVDTAERGQRLAAVPGGVGDALAVPQRPGELGGGVDVAQPRLGRGREHLGVPAGGAGRDDLQQLARILEGRGHAIEGLDRARDVPVQEARHRACVEDPGDAGGVAHGPVQREGRVGPFARPVGTAGVHVDDGRDRQCAGPSRGVVAGLEERPFGQLLRPAHVVGAERQHGQAREQPRALGPVPARPQRLAQVGPRPRQVAVCRRGVGVRPQQLTTQGGPLDQREPGVGVPHGLVDGGSPEPVGRGPRVGGRRLASRPAEAEVDGHLAGIGTVRSQGPGQVAVSPSAGHRVEARAHHLGGAFVDDRAAPVGRRHEPATGELVEVVRDGVGVPPDGQREEPGGGGPAHQREVLEDLAARGGLPVDATPEAALVPGTGGAGQLVLGRVGAGGESAVGQVGHQVGGPQGRDDVRDGERGPVGPGQQEPGQRVDGDRVEVRQRQVADREVDGLDRPGTQVVQQLAQGAGRARPEGAVPDEHGHLRHACEGRGQHAKAGRVRPRQVVEHQGDAGANTVLQQRDGALGLQRPARRGVEEIRGRVADQLRDQRRQRCAHPRVQPGHRRRLRLREASHDVTEQAAVLVTLGGVGRHRQRGVEPGGHLDEQA